MSDYAIAAIESPVSNAIDTLAMNLDRLEDRIQNLTNRIASVLNSNPVDPGPVVTVPGVPGESVVTTRINSLAGMVDRLCIDISETASRIEL